MPVPVRAGVGVVRRAAAAAARRRHLGVADDVLRSIGSSERRAIQAASRAEARYCASVNPSGPYVKPSCSIPTDCVFTLPVAGVPGDVGEVDELDDPAALRAMT